MERSTSEAMLSAVTIGGSMVDGDHVITKRTMRDVFLSGSSYSYTNMNSYYEHSLNNFAEIYVDNNPFVSTPKGPAAAP